MLVNNSKPLIKLIFNAKRLNIHTPFKSNSRIPSSMGVSEIQNMGGLTYKIYKVHCNFQYSGKNTCSISYTQSKSDKRFYMFVCKENEN